MTDLELIEDERPCPCCSGEARGDWFDLCEICTVAALDNRYPHGCSRPATATKG